MLSLLPILVALAAAPVPAASPAPPTPLTEIGHTHALPACTSIVQHANVAIGAALDGDHNLAILTMNIRATDFNKLNDLQRMNAVDALMKQASLVRTTAHSADAEIKTLRAEAKASTDPTRQAELKAFADALGGALARQDKAASDFMGSVTVINGRNERADMSAQIAAGTGVAGAGPGTGAYEPGFRAGAAAPPPQGQTTMTARDSGLPGPVAAGDYDKVFAELNARLAESTQEILRDEGTAADHSLSATTGC
jgi:hypothetical protein